MIEDCEILNHPSCSFYVADMSEKIYNSYKSDPSANGLNAAELRLYSSFMYMDGMGDIDISSKDANGDNLLAYCEFNRTCAFK